MMPRIFTYVLYKDGVVNDAAAELAAAAYVIDPSQRPTAILTGEGAHLDAAAESLRSYYNEVWKIGNSALRYPNAELVRKAVTAVLPEDAIVLIAHEHFGLDLAPGLAIKTNCTFVSDVSAIDAVRGNDLVVVRQEFGGQVNTRVRCDFAKGAVITVRPGAFKPVLTSAEGTVTDKSNEVGILTAGRRFIEIVPAECGDVDITKYPVLVSVGRGIQKAENIAIAQELAEEMGAAVSCSRPVVDAKWMPKPRQVGSSGKTVTPKVYLACGISGAFQHLAGLKGNPFIIAINKNAKAPIFQVADIGIVDDLLEFLPEMTNKVREMRGVSAK